MSRYLKQILDATAATRERSNGLAALLETLGAGGSSPAGGLSGEMPTATRMGGAPPVASGKGGVDDWINQALGILKLDSSYAPGVRNMIMKESSGNPRAINNWDSNARRGTPSKGLMQTIDPTFRQYALPGYDKDVYDPISNIIAGIRYARSRYGDGMIKQGGRKGSNGKYKGY